MKEGQEKLLAGAVLLLVIGGVLAWRFSAKPDGLPDSPHDAPGSPSFSMTTLSEKEGPEGYRSQEFFGLASVTGLAAEKLAELELRDTRGELETQKQSRADSAPLRKKQLQLGANVTVLGPVEDEPKKAGTARLLATIYLVHAGPFPGEHVKAKHQKVCAVVEVDPGGDAWAGGLRVGDLWVGVDATNLLGSAAADPCKDLTAASKGLAVGSDATFVVFRMGQRTELKVHKGSDRLKFVAIPVPVLDADKT
jgi:hypothetical protein